MINTQRLKKAVLLLGGQLLRIAIVIVVTLAPGAVGMFAADSADSVIAKVSDGAGDDFSSDQGDDTQSGGSELSTPEASNGETRPPEISGRLENGNPHRPDNSESESGLNDLEKLKQIIQDEASKDEVPIDGYDREHWAYQLIEQPPIPTFGDDVDREVANWPSNAVDAFLLRRMLDAGLRPAPATDRVTLIRRLSFDLTGLPPSLEEVDRFVADTRPNAYERLVDRILSTPEYGQKWAQYWLDLARFAETDGYEHDKIRETAWQYRDWVIQALNDDMPYDRFVSLQIAGDLIEPEDPSAKIATAFCLSGPDMPDINSQQERRHVLLNEITSTVGAVFLSLQMGCAQCHDHKYDAISQADFYRLRAFFEPAIELKANQSVTTLTSFQLKDPARLYDRGDWRSPGAIVEAAFPRVANLQSMRAAPMNHQALDKAKASQPPAKADGAGIPFDPKLTEALSSKQTLASTQTQSDHQRVQLADWLTDRQNPLVARSIVNRVWQFHFGKGLSTTPSDFGLVGQEPTHPDLLDFLTVRLTEGEWSLKRLHRELLCSSFYQMTSRAVGSEASRASWKESLQLDPENQLWSRFPRRRLDAESIRDAMLAVSGLLNPVMEGPGVRPPLPSELVKTLKSGQWKVSEDKSDHYRRSIYIFARRNLTYPLFATFDRPAANCTCAERVPSTTPIQSLSLFNSEFTQQIANKVVDVINSNLSEDIGEIQYLTSGHAELSKKVFQRASSQGIHLVDRSPSGDIDHSGRMQARQRLFDVCIAFFNTNLFLYVD